jgi:hypothetical protein
MECMKGGNIYFSQARIQQQTPEDAETQDPNNPDAPGVGGGARVDL